LEALWVSQGPEQLERYADNVEVAGESFSREKRLQSQKKQIPASQEYYRKVGECESLRQVYFGVKTFLEDLIEKRVSANSNPAWSIDF
jgi:hypothetical protein